MLYKNNILAFIIFKRSAEETCIKYDMYLFIGYFKCTSFERSVLNLELLLK